MFNMNNKNKEDLTNRKDLTNGKDKKGQFITSPVINLIGQGTSIKGDIRSEGDLRIDGKVTGTIRSKAKIVIGNTGIIDGDVNCQNADISGK